VADTSSDDSNNKSPNAQTRRAAPSSANSIDRAPNPLGTLAQLLNRWNDKCFELWPPLLRLEAECCRKPLACVDVWSVTDPAQGH
jgi:hypothetical protein